MARKAACPRLTRARIAHQQHQSDAGNRIYHHQRNFAQVEIVESKRRRDHSDNQQTKPELLAVVFEDTYILLVARFEDKTHYTFFRCIVANMPSGRMNSINNKITYALTSADPDGP